MNKEQLGEFLYYFYIGDKLRCVQMIKLAYGMSVEESKEWCERYLFGMVEKIKARKEKEKFRG